MTPHTLTRRRGISSIWIDLRKSLGWRGGGFIVALVLGLAVAGCSAAKSPDNTTGKGITPETHRWFPIMAGAAHAIDRDIAEGKMACQSCHSAGTTSFKAFSCVGCHGHEQTVTDRLHTNVQEYGYTSDKCYSCHMTSEKVAFDHVGATKDCAMCHDVGTPFAALPKDGFTHPPTGGADCAGCHSTKDWKGATGAPTDVRDPDNDLTLTALIPTYSGMSMSALSPRVETLPMMMNHASPDIVPTVVGVCTNCHMDAASAVYFPGNLHASLAVLGKIDPTVIQPTACASCHTQTMPIGFVGPTATTPARTPASGEMKHDAVAWMNDAPTKTTLVSTNCGQCHLSPSRSRVLGWSTSLAGTSPAVYHPALDAAGVAQPTTCIDCHANSRPVGLLTSANSSVPVGLQFDHGTPEAQRDCVSCHAQNRFAGWTSWGGGLFHPMGGAAPSTCLPCHASERPTATTGWQSATYKDAPFDYVGNATGATHGAGQDCATCHSGPGTGAWGGTQNWVNGKFPHGPTTVAGTTCIACHTSQRPDLQPGTTAAAMATLIGFDHAANGTGECFGCHQATVVAGSYVNYTNPTTKMLPSGDWKGGQPYPGSSFASGGDTSIKITTTTLNRSGPHNLVTSTSPSTVTLYNGIVHTAKAIPAALNAGPSTAPDNTKCWHCHTNTNGTVTQYKAGVFHAALTKYAATVGGTVMPFPQPTSNCAECHLPMLPKGIVQKAGSSLQPMDHAIEFTAAVTIGGASVTKVSQMDCSICHASPPSTWADGVFHAKIGAAVPKDCVSCHYMVMADAAKSDVKSGTNYTMKHGSTTLTFQTCQTCHTSALAKGAMTPIAATLWQTGALHATVSPQPSTCLECHAVSEPTVSTQGALIYALAMGATATNGAQWMNHKSGTVAGKDCVACHAADAKPTGSAWSKSSAFHAAVPAAKTCNECHGITNGGGTVAGTKNNLPAGLTNSSMVTRAATGATTGIPAGTLDQIDHGDTNASSHDCGFCHTQVGPSTVAGVQGKEWAQARFHANFTSAGSALVVNGTTGRCSTCHMNVKPTKAFTALDHSAFTAVSGSVDCSSCHSYPGTGSAASPNWLGAGGMPQYIPVGGFTVAQPPATSATVQKGITNLPHPTVATGGKCTDCHKDAAGGKMAIGYDHKSTLINANCNSCHEAGSNLVGTVWNGATTQGSGAGDTRPFTIVGLKPENKKALTNDFKHFFSADCGQCHAAPSGVVVAATGTTYTSRWKFNHNEGKMKGTCDMCHGSPNNIPGD